MSVYLSVCLPVYSKHFISFICDKKCETGSTYWYELSQSNLNIHTCIEDEGAHARWHLMGGVESAQLSKQALNYSFNS